MTIKVMPVPTASVFECWGWLLPKLRPALERPEADETSWDVLDSLVSGRREAFVITGEIDGLVILGAEFDGDTSVLWVAFAAGKVSGGPKERVGRIRFLMNEIEAVGRRVACDEVRIRGRMSWRRALQDYELKSCGGRSTLIKRL